MASQGDYDAFKSRVARGRGPRTGLTTETLVSEMKSTYAPLYEAVARMNEIIKGERPEAGVEFDAHRPELLRNEVKTQIRAYKGEVVEKYFDVTMRPGIVILDDSSQAGLMTTLGSKFEPEQLDIATTVLLDVIGRWFQDENL